jgi:hypothetical protein
MIREPGGFPGLHNLLSAGFDCCGEVVVESEVQGASQACWSTLSQYSYAEVG